jgi:nucleoside-diphosphate kinase
MAKTLVLIKPDAVERNLIGEIISIYEKKGFHIAALKIIKPAKETARTHYIEHEGKPYFARLVDFITRGEVCAIILEGENVIETVRRINGATDPANAEPGTIRFQYSASMSENSVHSSDSAESAEREMKVWFPEIEAL